MARSSEPPISIDSRSETSIIDIAIPNQEMFVHLRLDLDMIADGRYSWYFFLVLG